MKAQEIRVMLENKTQQMRAIINSNMLERGLKSNDCQRMALLNAISEVEHLINGIEQSDINSWEYFKPTTDDKKEIVADLGKGNYQGKLSCGLTWWLGVDCEDFEDLSDSYFESVIVRIYEGAIEGHINGLSWKLYFSN